MEIMRKFSEQYAKGSGTYFCMDLSVTAVVIKVVKTQTCSTLHCARLRKVSSGAPPLIPRQINERIIQVEGSVVRDTAHRNGYSALKRWQVSALERSLMC
eukprot:2650989-Pyramimonas_sp.AAC.2